MIQEQTGARYIPSGTDKTTILGQSTTMWEFRQQIDEIYGTKLDAVILPIGAGSLLAGSILASLDTDIRFFGAEPVLASQCAQWLETGKKPHLPMATTTIADGIRMGVQDLPFSILKSRVEGVFTVKEEEIAQAMRVGFEILKMTVEPSAAVALAVLLFNENFRQLLGTGIRNIGIILEGGNVDTDSYEKMMPWLFMGNVDSKG
jgi:threonine dehydratase